MPEGTFVPAAKITEKEQFSIVTNYLGTPEAMYREDGEAVWTCELNSYGKVRNFQGESKTMCPFRYQGQYEDAETGLYYNRFRYYSPEEGMYLSQDPIGLNGGINLYAYVHDPNSWIDGFGLTSNSAILGGNLGIPPGINHDAHHIVMAGSSDPRMIDLRDKMSGYGIDINSKENGIWLPRTNSDKVDTRTAHKGEGVHSDSYKQHVYDKLIKTNSKQEFLKELKKVKKELKSGKTFTCK
jgi:RHS repeat-associated protein